MPTPCDCPLSNAKAHCPRHRVALTVREQELCRTRQDYFNLFASGTSPQHQREAKLAGQPVRRGLGDVAASILGAVGIKGWKGCGCAKRRKRLNEMGWKVADWLKGGADPAGAPERSADPEAP